MEKTHLLKLTVVSGVVIMIISFVIIPDQYPWYYELLLFNAGLWPWLFAMKQLKEMNAQLNQN